MTRMGLKQLTLKQLRLLLASFFVAIITPTGVLIYQAYDQIKWEAFHQQQRQAQELVTRIDQAYRQHIDAESARAFTDYTFLNIVGNKQSNLIQRSPLSQFPLNNKLKGVMGYFQIDHKGQFTTPLLPYDRNTQALGLSKEEYAQRLAVQDIVFNVLHQNDLLKSKPSLSASSPAPIPQKEGTTTALADSLSSSKQLLSQESFDNLVSKKSASPKKKPRPQKNLGKLDDLNLEESYTAAEKTEAEPKQSRNPYRSYFSDRKRKEQSVLPEQRLEAGNAIMEQDTARLPASTKIETFESEIDPFEFGILDSDEFVLYRKVWRNNQRYIQGILIDADKHINNFIAPRFRQSNLSRISQLAVAYNGDIISIVQGQTASFYDSSISQITGSLLYRTRLSPPLSNIELAFTINQLPIGSGGQIIIWMSIIVTMVMLIGFIFLYRLGASQLRLNQQQQDFVSAVSHELKTPLTSIRMYGEMLREGWADQQKQKTYYDYIYTESERLSRLINNVLQLARMTRNDLQIELNPITVSELIDTLRSKITSQIEQHQFVLQLDCTPQATDCSLAIDTDYFSQIMINLVDNAIKFSSKAEKKQIDIQCQANQTSVTFTIRDYGPGIAKNQMRKIFTLFYRSENELTRETVGTGIGLALVHQLVGMMNGEIDVTNQQPGAQFTVRFPIVQQNK